MRNDPSKEPELAVRKKSLRQLNAEARRSDLIEATIRCIADYGIAGASVEKITETAGVSRGMVRHYFGSKSQLLTESFQRLADEFRSVLQEGDGEADRDPEGLVRKVIVDTFHAPRFSPERLHAWFGFWHAARSFTDLQRINEQIYSEQRTRYRELLRAAAAKRGRLIDDKQAGYALAALADGVWLELLIDPANFTTADAVAICNHYIDLVLGEEA
jgi:TetR/AcrR family transcriptional regulator, transcriptional repressor of bet genes